jgi:hypothetical protein
MNQQTVEHEVKCILTEDDHAAGMRIIQIGGDGWQKKLSDVIYELDFGCSTFFTYIDGVRAEIHKVSPASGSPYIRTDRDDENTNNLLNLPQCLTRIP